jgi:hypothetical protein
MFTYISTVGQVKKGLQEERGLDVPESLVRSVMKDTLGMRYKKVR